MHSTTCGVGAAATNATSASLQTNPTDGPKMVHNTEDPMNKIPLKSSSGLDDEEKNGGEFASDTAAAQEAKREQMRANVLKWMKKLTIGLICFIGIALITYVIISLCFSDWPKSTPSTNMTTTAKTPQQTTAQSLQATTSPFSSSSTLAQTTATVPSTTQPILNASFSTTDESTSSATSSFSESTSRMPTPAPLIFKDAPNTQQVFESTLGVFEHAAACTDKQVCSDIASYMMKNGGSVVDGAISALLCNGIVTMQSMGIGGASFMNIYIKEDRHAYALDAFYVAPFAAYPEMFDNQPDTLSGGHTIGVPGELMGYYRAHERFGKLPWKTLVEPAIKICEEGIYMTKHIQMGLDIKWYTLKDDPVLVNIFYDPKTGEKYPVGTKLKPHKKLCETYKLLAENGPLDFYNGTLAKMVVEDLKDMGSLITSYDLESYTADLVSSITMQLGNDTLYALPPTSSGTLVASVLSILEGYNFTQSHLKGLKNQALTMHRISEAFKFAFAKRAELGDLRFNDVRELVSQLTNPEYNMQIRARINDSGAHEKLSDYDAQFLSTEDKGTSHMSFFAPNGDALSVTSTINDYFGSGRVGKRTGIIFNSGMNDFAVAHNKFSVPPSPTNLVEARKRPMSSMAPTIITDQNGDVRLVIGAAGGSKIISSVVEIIVHVLWMGQTIKEAIDAPRFHHQLIPDSLTYEYNNFSEELIKLLEELGQHTKPYKDIGSVACGIYRNGTTVYANADFRKRGGVSGF